LIQGCLEHFVRPCEPIVMLPKWSQTQVRQAQQCIVNGVDTGTWRLDQRFRTVLLTLVLLDHRSAPGETVAAVATR
jgi:hypothetical protein